MKKSDFYLCEEDNVFDVLSSLYEDIQPCPYADAPGLDPNLGWEDDLADVYDLDEDYDEYDEYGADPIEFYRGDILLAKVHQMGDNKNLAHAVRPFVVVYATANMAYGFQITSSIPATLVKYLVDIPNYESCGLRYGGSFVMNMVRGVQIDKIRKYIGRITKEQKQAMLDKLYEIKEDKEGLFADCVLKDKPGRLDDTIKNIEVILAN